MLPLFEHGKFLMYRARLNDLLGRWGVFGNRFTMGVRFEDICRWRMDWVLFHLLLVNDHVLVRGLPLHHHKTLAVLGHLARETFNRFPFATGVTLGVVG